MHIVIVLILMIIVMAVIVVGKALLLKPTSAKTASHIGAMPMIPRSRTIILTAIINAMLI